MVNDDLWIRFVGASNFTKIESGVILYKTLYVVVHNDAVTYYWNGKALSVIPIKNNDIDWENVPELFGMTENITISNDLGVRHLLDMIFSTMDFDASFLSWFAKTSKHSQKKLVRNMRVTRLGKKLQMAMAYPFQGMEEGKLHVAIYPQFFPIAYIKHDQCCGMEVDIIRSFASLHELEVVFHIVSSYEGLWDLPRRGECDVAIGGMANIPSRSHPETEWTIGYFSVKRTLLYNPSVQPLTSIQDIDQPIRGTFGSTGFVNMKEMFSLYGKNPQWIHASFNDDEKDIEDVVNGTILGIMRGDVVAKAIQHKYPHLRLLPPWKLHYYKALGSQNTVFPQGENFSFPCRLGSGLAVALTAYLNYLHTSNKFESYRRKYYL
jgi:hypothetical protein